ncbi:hypothetical protein F5X99DRAFT_431169 [Biscogniauxia marginata]|nr:hypothetical protein F5X99DRAFT_431169 [Biscogniauxia marginata]
MKGQLGTRRRNAATTSLLLLLSPLLLSYAQATPTPQTLHACSDIVDALPAGRVAYPGDLAYRDETASYWSTALREVEPACVVRPTAAGEVAAVVSVLNAHPDVTFAVKSGGHDPNPGHATAQDGVLVATRQIAGATYDAGSGIASVGPGGEWNDVIGDLEPYGVTIVGGRLGVVGVGGYLLQGGISFLSAQYGLAADNIVGWEVVMANGSVVNVDAEAHPDLAVAMRGSGSQFGIVTQFKVQAYPISKVWGGYRFFTADKDDELYAALHSFIPYAREDPKAAIIHTTLLTVGSTESHIIFFFYDGEKPPAEGPFADYMNVLPLADITSVKNYSSLLKANGDASAILNARISFRTYTIPYIPSQPGIYAEIRDKWRSVTTAYLNDPLHLTSQCSVDFQPFPSAIGQRSEAAGGNAMGLRGSDPDRLVLELQCSWPDPAHDAEMYELSREMTSWLDEAVPRWLGNEGGEGELYLPYLMNDAQADQNVTGSYRDYARFAALQREVDPRGLFRTRAGGFKY